MRLFSRAPEPLEPDDVVTLLWRYEVSDDGGKSWRPEADRDDPDTYCLRRGNWVAPPVN